MQAVAHSLPLSLPQSKVPLQLVANSGADPRPLKRTDPLDFWLEAYCRFQDNSLHEEIAAGEGDDWLRDIT